MNNIIRIKLKLNDIHKIFNVTKIKINTLTYDDPKIEYNKNNWIHHGAISTLYNGKLHRNYNITSKYVSWPKKTNIKCWHCTLKFDTCPIGLPYKIEKFDNSNSPEKWIYHTKGCFCSFSCAISYNMKNEQNYVEQENFLYMLYRRVGGIKEIINKAPSHIFLIEYGGPLSRVQYRALLDIGSISSYQIPPLISPIPTFNITLLSQPYNVKSDSIS